MSDPLDDRTDGMSPAVRSFYEELEQLCLRHGMQLTVSAYDTIDIWQLRPGGDPVYVPGVRDMTQQSE